MFTADRLAMAYSHDWKLNLLTKSRSGWFAQFFRGEKLMVGEGATAEGALEDAFAKIGV